MHFTKIFTNFAHLALLGASAWISVHPEYAWAIPALQAAGNMLPPPDFEYRDYFSVFGRLGDRRFSPARVDRGSSDPLAPPTEAGPQN